MRICIEKLTGKLIEAQSGGDVSNPQHLQTLIDNAVNSGYNETDIEAKYITDAEFDTLMKSTPEYLARVAAQQAKVQAIIENLPSWAQVKTSCDNISSLAEAKAYLKKLSRVVYWLAKDAEE